VHSWLVMHADTSERFEGYSEVARAPKMRWPDDMLTRKDMVDCEDGRLLVCAPARMQHLAALPSRGFSHCAVPGGSHSLTLEPLAGDRKVLAPAWSTPGPELPTQRLGDDSCTTSHKTGEHSQVQQHPAMFFQAKKGATVIKASFLTLLML
jgi:hypothetical protein